MRKSNGALWTLARLSFKASDKDSGKEPGAWWGGYSEEDRHLLALYADAVRADEAEHAKDEQRQVCVKAYIDALRTGGGDIECQVAIRNAGKAPAIKPGMLVVRRDSLPDEFAFVWADDGNSDLYRILTRAEIQLLMDKAPE